MSGAVMLLMAATVGITYGWTPDRGDGVKYIIQIPPDKMEQVARSGEISSQIPPEIRGHVSEVVIRVGEGNVPRITPNHISRRGSGSSSSLAAADQVPMPIPSMGDPAELRPIGTAGPASTAMMKPAPQGGMNMPGGFSATPPATVPSTSPADIGFGSTGFANAPPASTGFNSSGLEQAAREAADNFGKQYSAATEAGRQQIQQNVDSAVGRMGDAVNAQVQSATSGLQNAANEMIYGPIGPPSAADDPRTRLTQGSSSAQPPRADSSASAPSSGYASPPNFATAPPSPRSSTSASSTSAFPPSTSPSTSSPSSPSGRTVSTPPLNAAVRDEDWYALNNGSNRRPSTTPASSSGGAFSGGNFGQLPGGLQPAANSSSSQSNSTASGYTDRSGRTASTNNDLNYDPQLSPAQAAKLPRNGYSYDAEGYPVDSQGYRLNMYGQRVNRQGELLAAGNAVGEPEHTSGTSNTNERGGSGYANSRPPENFERDSAMPPLVQAPRSRPGTSGRDLDEYAPDPDPRLAGLQDRSGNDYRQPGSLGWNDGRSRSVEDDLDSASDAQARRERQRQLEASNHGGAGELDRDPEQVAAQPIFNALLLLSVVANVYLLFWLRNMREQFRDMVAAKRAASTGGSLATGI